MLTLQVLIEKQVKKGKVKIMAKSRASGAGGVPNYLGQTEKAVKLTIGIDYYNLEKAKEYSVWIPKSQLAKDGRPGEWISRQKASDVAELRYGGGTFSYWRDGKGLRFKPSKTTKEIEYDRRSKSALNYYDLIKQAKSLNVKGVRVGMKRKTIEEKIKKATG